MKIWHIALGTGVAALAAVLVFGTGAAAVGTAVVAGSKGQDPAPTPAPAPASGESSVEEIVAAYPQAAPVAARLIMLARKLGTKPQFIANVIQFESKWDPAIVNRASNATGLIQFIPPTAKGLGTTTSALAGMNIAQQFAYVEKYFLGVGKKLPTQIDVFMAVFYPRAIGKGPNWVIGSDRDAAYVAKIQAQNPGIRTAADYASLAIRRAKLPVV